MKTPLILASRGNFLLFVEENLKIIFLQVRENDLWHVHGRDCPAGFGTADEKWSSLQWNRVWGALHSLQVPHQIRFRDWGVSHCNLTLLPHLWFFFVVINPANTTTVVRCWTKSTWVMGPTRIAQIFVMFAPVSRVGLPTLCRPVSRVLSTAWLCRGLQWALMAPCTVSTRTSMTWWRLKSPSWSRREKYVFFFYNENWIGINLIFFSSILCCLKMAVVVVRP